MRTKTATAVLLVAALAATGPASAIEQDELKKHPGYVDFSEVDIAGNAKEKVEIYVTPALLKFVASATCNEDPEFAKFISKLLLVNVNVFSVNKDIAEDFKKKIVDIESILQSQKWQKVVRVTEPGEQVSVYMKLAEEKVVGMVVMVVEDKGEAAFVNIVGEIDFNSLGKLGSTFNIPHLNEIPAN